MSIVWIEKKRREVKAKATLNPFIKIYAAKAASKKSGTYIVFYPPMMEEYRLQIGDRIMVGVDADDSVIIKRTLNTTGWKVMARNDTGCGVLYVPTLESVGSSFFYAEDITQDGTGCLKINRAMQA